MKGRGITNFMVDVLFFNCKVAKETKTSRLDHKLESPGRTPKG